MALDLYLDDCSNGDLLDELLRRAGHRVIRPTHADVGLEGADDDVHLRYAAANGLTLVTKNPADFLELHKTDQRHPGILAIYQDNDPSRDMSDAEIVKAIANLEGAAQSGGDPIAGRFHVLNYWRF
jgi:predicted nuclease of predicted toxin-antitoxin system